MEIEFKHSFRNLKLLEKEKEEMFQGVNLMSREGNSQTGHRM